MCDSLPAMHCGVNGDPTGSTPNLDALASQGVNFKRAYCNSPLCTPSRASLLTGRYASELGCLDNAGSFSSEWPTIAHVLDAAGYESVIIGKMHLVGHDQWHGFHDRLALDTDYTHGYDPDNFRLAYDWDQPSSGNPIGHDWMGPSYVRDPKWDDFRLHYDRDEQIHRAALAYLDRKSEGGDPFFCCVSYHAPHNPFWIPERIRERYRRIDLPLPSIPDGAEPVQGLMDRWLCDFHYIDEIQDRLLTEDNLRWLYETYYGMVNDLDHRLGALLDKLKKRGLADNTAVVFVSDHGDMMGNRGMVQKRCFYEPSVRVPLVACLPGSSANGIHLNTPVSLIDLLPTFAAMAGVSVPADLPGCSLLECIREGVEPPQRTVFAEYHGEGVHAPCFLAICGDQKYFYIPNCDERLFDLADDPGEWTNRIDDPGYAENATMFRKALNQQFDTAAIEAQARRSQRNRRFIHSTSRGNCSDKGVS